MDMSTPILWHNPRCTKSRETLKLLKEHGVAPDIRLYLEDAPTEEEIRDALEKLGIPAIGLVRTKEKLFRELGLARDMPDDALIRAMAAHPRLIERPVLFANGKAALGRPPEQVLGIL